MDQLKEARQRIDQIDEEMARLFCERMQAAELVAEHKKVHGLPVYDKDREAALINKNMKLVENPVYREYYVNFLKDVMKISRQYQHRLLQGMKVGYSGVEGAFAAIAAGKIFPDAEKIACGDFKEAYDSVVSGDCDAAVLPIENSSAGEVGQVMDLIFSGSLYINGVFELAINQNLLGLPGAQTKDIHTVISHPQALSQCASYIKEHGFEQISFVNTALAAQHVQELGDIHTAAIASKETAELYGLEVLEPNINSSRSNTTKFAVFSRAEAAGRSPSEQNFILVFTVRNEVGSLAKAMNIVGRYGFNMRALRSRPMKTLLWQYYFYLEAEGDIHSPAGQSMLAELSECCDRLKMIGTFNLHEEL